MFLANLTFVDVIVVKKKSIIKSLLAFVIFMLKGYVKLISCLALPTRMRKN